MKLTFDYHTHTIYSHGLGTIADNVKAAHRKGLKEIAISDHGPGHVAYGLKKVKIQNMRNDIEALKPLYPDMKILLGIEANIIDKSGGLDIDKELAKQFDLILAGYHYGTFGKNPILAGTIHAANFFATCSKRRIDPLVKLNTEMMIKAVYENNIAILTHPGSKAYVDIREIAKACADTNTLMEISNSHRHLTVNEIKEAAKENVRFVISSDAHVPDSVGRFEKGLRRAVDAGLDIERIVNLQSESGGENLWSL